MFGGEEGQSRDRCRGWWLALPGEWQRSCRLLEPYFLLDERVISRASGESSRAFAIARPGGGEAARVQVLLCSLKPRTFLILLRIRAIFFAQVKATLVLTTRRGRNQP